MSDCLPCVLQVNLLGCLHVLGYIIPSLSTVDGNLNAFPEMILLKEDSTIH